MDGAKFYDFTLLQVVSHVLLYAIDGDLTDPSDEPLDKDSVLLLDNCWSTSPDKWRT